MENRTKKAALLLSGGLDSATCLYWAAFHERSDVREIRPIHLQYGQRHEQEIEAAFNLVHEAQTRAKHQRSDVKISPMTVIDLRHAGIFEESSLLKGSPWAPQHAVKCSVCQGCSPEERKTPSTEGTDIPTTYVPGRNIVFLSIAAANAASWGCDALIIGTNEVDYSGYPDCTLEFIEAFEVALSKGLPKPLSIYRYLCDKSKAEIIKSGADLGVPYELTHSCYDPSEEGLACGTCDSCRIRAKGFQDAGVSDPTVYVTAVK